MSQMKSDREKLAAELEIIRGMDKDGLLHPESVVAWARNNKESALYNELEWDDTAAAEAYRVAQVRQIVRVIVRNAPGNDGIDRRTRVYVSVPSDRLHGGGYRPDRRGPERRTPGVG